MPIEKLHEWRKTMTFWSFKTKGTYKIQKTDKMDYAVVQLRQDDKEGSYII